MPKTSSHNTVLLQTCFKTSYISVNAVLQPLHSQDKEEGLSDSCALPFLTSQILMSHVLSNCSVQQEHIHFSISQQQFLNQRPPKFIATKIP